MFRWRSGGGAAIAALVAGTAIAILCVAVDRRLKQTGTTFAAEDSVINPNDARPTALLRRYEAVVLTIAGIIVATHVAGGSFRAPRTEAAADMTTLDTTRQPMAQAFIPPAHPVDPVLEAPFALPGFSAPELVASIPELAASDPPPTFADSGSFGDSVPLAELKTAPGGIAVGQAGDLWVASATTQTLLHLGADGSLRDTFRVGDTQGGFAGVILGANGDLTLLATNPAAVLRFSPASQATTLYSTIPDVAVPCTGALVATDCDPSTVNQPPTPTAMVFDPLGRLYVADATQGTVWRVPAGGGEPTAFIARQDWTNALRPAGPTGLVFDRAGNLIIAVQATFSQDTGVLFSQAIRRDGAAGELTQLATTGAGSRPASVAAAADGQLFVTLKGSGRVLALNPDAKSPRLTPRPSTPALANPAALAFRGQSVLAATQGANADTGRLVRLPVGTTGAALYIS